MLLVQVSDRKVMANEGMLAARQLKINYRKGRHPTYSREGGSSADSGGTLEIVKRSFLTFGYPILKERCQLLL